MLPVLISITSGADGGARRRLERAGGLRRPSTGSRRPGAVFGPRATRGRSRLKKAGLGGTQEGSGDRFGAHLLLPPLLTDFPRTLQFRPPGRFQDDAARVARVAGARLARAAPAAGTSILLGPPPLSPLLFDPSRLLSGSAFGGPLWGSAFRGHPPRSASGGILAWGEARGA